MVSGFEDVWEGDLVVDLSLLFGCNFFFSKIAFIVVYFENRRPLLLFNAIHCVVAFVEREKRCLRGEKEGLGRPRDLHSGLLLWFAKWGGGGRAGGGGRVYSLVILHRKVLRY